MKKLSKFSTCTHPDAMQVIITIIWNAVSWCRFHTCSSLNPKPSWYFLNYIITSQSSSHGMLCLGAGLIPVGLMNPKPNLYFRTHIITLVLDIIHTIMTGELQTPRAQFSLLTSKQVTGL